MTDKEWLKSMGFQKAKICTKCDYLFTIANDTDAAQMTCLNCGEKALKEVK